MNTYIIIGIILFIIILLLIVFKKQITFFIVAVTGKKRIQKKLYKECKKNDYLILNDLYFPISNNEYRYIDTIIFGNKYFYIIKEIKQAGEVKIAIDDNKWRIIYNGSLITINNPLFELQRRVEKIINVVPNIEKKDFKCIVAFTKTCKFESINNNNNEFIIKENEIMSVINEIEKKSDVDIIDSKEVERYANAFYKYCLKAEYAIKNQKKR